MQRYRTVQDVLPGPLRASQRARSLSPGAPFRRAQQPDDAGARAAAGGLRPAPTPRTAASGSASARRPVAVMQRGALPAPPVAVAPPRQAQSPPPIVGGLTRSDMFSAPTPELTSRLQANLVRLVSRVSEDAPQHLHSVRQIDDICTEVLARWRRSIRTAIDSMSTLEDELARRSEGQAAAYARLADKDAALASIEASRVVLRAYATRLEVFVASLVEQQAAGPPEGAKAAVATLLAAAREEAGLQGADGGASGAQASVVAEADRLAVAVKAASRSAPSTLPPAPALRTSPSGSLASAGAAPTSLTTSAAGGSDRVAAFFEALDATYVAPMPASPRSTHSSPRLLPAAAGVSAPPALPLTMPAALAHAALPEAHKAALRAIDATLSRALSFVGKAGGGTPASPPPVPAPAAAPAPSSRVASLYVEFEPAMHARATVGALKLAVGTKAGRRILSIAHAGIPLLDDSVSLAAAGVPLRTHIDVVFEREGGGAPGEEEVVPAPVVAPTVALPAAQPLPPAKRSPVLRARPLPSPAPHAALGGLSTTLASRRGLLPGAGAPPPLEIGEEREAAPISRPSAASTLSPVGVLSSPIGSRPDRFTLRAESARLLSLAEAEDGRPSLFHSALAHPSQARQRDAVAQSIFSRVDADKSGSVEWEELQGYVEQVQAKVAEDAETGEEGEGGILAPDGVPYAVHAAFCSVLASAGLSAAFARFDINGDGVLSRDEFRVMVDEVLTGKYDGKGGLHGEGEAGRRSAALAAEAARAEEAAAAAAARAAAAAARAAAGSAEEADVRAARARTALDSVLALGSALPSPTVPAESLHADVAHLQKAAQARQAGRRRAGEGVAMPLGKKTAAAGADASTQVAPVLSSDEVTRGEPEPEEEEEEEEGAAPVAPGGKAPAASTLRPPRRKAAERDGAALRSPLPPPPPRELVRSSSAPWHLGTEV